MSDNAERLAPPARPHKNPRVDSPLRRNLARVFALLFVVLITLSVYAIRDQTEQLARYGYPGIFLLMLLVSSAVILPAPGLAIVFALGGVLSPAGVALAAAAGSALGELSGYLAGYSGQAVIENRQMYDRLTAWMDRYGPVTIALLAFIPLPFIDLAGIAAGALKMAVQRFVFWCFLGKLPKMLLVAFAGAYSLDWFARFFS